MILDDLPKRGDASRFRGASSRKRWRAPVLRRAGVVYGIPTYHPDTGDIVVGYVGRTFQTLAAREQQHRDTQPWSDTIVGDLGAAYVIETGMFTVDEIEQREAVHMRRLLPLYPYEFNLDNPHRIPIFEARGQRARRDAARGVRSQWSAPAVPQQRRRVSRLRPAPATTPAVSSADAARWQRLTWWAYGWVALTTALVAVLVLGLGVAAGNAVELGVAGSTLLLGMGKLASLSRRKRARLKRLAVRTAVALAVAATLWMVFVDRATEAGAR